MGKLTETVWHHWLRVPYTLHVYRESRVKDPRATLVFLHGIGNSGRTWDSVLEELPSDVDAVVVDLLGFGDSPQPDWATYDAKTQAQALAKTLLSIGTVRQTIPIGHSMGALVAVEFAKRFPLAVQGLLLCSPPLYNVTSEDDKKFFVGRDEQLRRLYELAIVNPNNIVMFSRFAKQYRLLNPDFDVDHMNVDSYIAALRANILNQTTLADIEKISKPIHIIYGTLDPFVIGTNIKKAAKNPRVSVTKFIGGHEVVGRYVEKTSGLLRQIVDDLTKNI